MAERKYSKGNSLVTSLLEKAPWPAEGIRHGSSPKDYQWGYLYLYGDGRAKFVLDEQPDLKEIEARWGHYFRN